MAYNWKRGGYQNSVEYDQNAGVVKYGDYEFHYKDLGLDKYSVQIDPAQIKAEADVYKMLGVEPASQRQNDGGIAGMLYNRTSSNMKPGEAWKQTAAQQIWSQIDNERNPNRIVGGGFWGNFNTNQRNEGSWVGNTYQPAEPRGFGAIGLYGNNDPKPIQSLTKLDNGMYEIAYSDIAPDDYEFVNRVSSMANALSASIAGGDGSAQRPRRKTATGAF